MERTFPSWLRSAGSLRVAIPVLVVALGLAGYVLTSSMIGRDRDAAASRRAQIVGVRTEGFLARARAYAAGLGRALATEPVAGQEVFAQVVGRWAAAAGLVDGLWVQERGGSRLVATYTRRTGGELRPGVDVSDWPGLGAAIRDRASVFGVSASALGSFEGQPGFYLLDGGSFGRGSSGRGYLATFVPRGWLTSSLEEDLRRVAISVDGRRLEGGLDSAPTASTSFDALGRRWGIDVGREPPTGLQSAVPWLALAWPIATALIAFVVGSAILRRRRAERDAEQIFDLSGDLLAVAGLDGYFKRVNPAFERTFGYSTEEMLSRPFLEFVHPEDLEKSIEAMQVLSSGQDVSQFENRNIRSDGAVRWIQWSTRSFPEKGLVYTSGRDVTESRRAAAEQAALRRVATLVARGASLNEVIDAVCVEVHALFGADSTVLARYEPDDVATVLAIHGRTTAPGIGTRWTLEGDNVLASIRRTGRFARIDDYSGAGGSLAELAREQGFKTVIGVPIIVEGEVWGATVARWTHDQTPLDQAESRMAGFTELVATAIANAESRAALSMLADEQAALRRVATLVARGVPPAEVLDAVSVEMRALFRADSTALGRYEDDTVTVLAAHGSTTRVAPVGARLTIEGENVIGAVLRTGRPARMDSYEDAHGTLATFARELDLRAVVGVPIIVEARLWGVAVCTWTVEYPAVGDVESRMIGFTELIATAIANAEGRAELAASRVRIVSAADEARRRIERDLHDGTQQRLISLVLSLRAAEDMAPFELEGLRAELAKAANNLVEVTDDLREMSRGIHPAILSQGGLGPALKTLARRASVPVSLDVHLDGRFPEPVEVATYYVVSEALANTARHAQASAVDVVLNAEDSMVVIAIHDDGVGGADPGRGSGLTGLRDRIEALGGTLEIVSSSGRGTTLLAKMPIDGSEEVERFSGGA